MKPALMARCKIAISTSSLGKSASGHHITRKLQVAKAHGFEGVEVAFDCLEAHATSFNTPRATRADRLRAAAKDVFLTASSLQITIIALGPFGSYDCLTDPLVINLRLEEAKLWLQLCSIMEATFLQVYSPL